MDTIRMVDGCRDNGPRLGGQRRLCSKRHWNVLSREFDRVGDEVAGCDVVGVMAMYTTPSKFVNSPCQVVWSGIGGNP